MNADSVPFHGIVVSVGWHRPTEYRSGIQFNKSLSPRYAAPLNEKSTKNHTGTFFCETPCTASIGSESHLLLDSRSQLSNFGYRRLSESHIVMEKDHTYMIGMQWIMHWKNKVGRSDLILGMYVNMGRRCPKCTDTLIFGHNSILVNWVAVFASKRVWHLSPWK